MEINRLNLLTYIIAGITALIILFMIGNSLDITSAYESNILLISVIVAFLILFIFINLLLKGPITIISLGLFPNFIKIASGINGDVEYTWLSDKKVLMQFMRRFLLIVIGGTLLLSTTILLLTIAMMQDQGGFSMGLDSILTVVGGTFFLSLLLAPFAVEWTIPESRIDRYYITTKGVGELKVNAYERLGGSPVGFGSRLPSVKYELKPIYKPYEDISFFEDWDNAIKIVCSEISERGVKREIELNFRGMEEKSRVITHLSKHIPPSRKKEKFREKFPKKAELLVEDAIQWSSDKLVVMGRVIFGVIKSKDKGRVNDKMFSIEKIEKGHRVVDMATNGEDIALTVQGLMKSDVKKGDMIII